MTLASVRYPRGSPLTSSEGHHDNGHLTFPVYQECLHSQSSWPISHMASWPRWKSNSRFTVFTNHLIPVRVKIITFPHDRSSLERRTPPSDLSFLLQIKSAIPCNTNFISNPRPAANDGTACTLSLCMIAWRTQRSEVGRQIETLNCGLCCTVFLSHPNSCLNLKGWGS